MVFPKAASSNDNTQNRLVVAPPEQCGSRERTEDAAHVVKEMVNVMKHMDPDIVGSLVRARIAAESISMAFPEGDQRFADADSDLEDGNYENENEDDDENDNDGLEEPEMPDEGSTTPNQTYGAPDEDEEVCYGLLDSTLYRSPQMCLQKTKQKFGFDLIGTMDSADINLIQRIRLVNHIRKLVAESMSIDEVIQRARNILEERDETVLENDTLLIPVVEGDLLLTVLESGDDRDAEILREAADVRNAVEVSLREEDLIP